MKLIQRKGSEFVFEFGKREKEMLGAVLCLYPMLNPDHHEISKTPDTSTAVQESQALLREAMAQARAENKAQVARFLADKNWRPVASGQWRVTLHGEQMEWLLQVLNDVRVGCWVRLGKPDPDQGNMAPPTAENLPYMGAMELSGLFQTLLLHAMEQ